MLWQACEKLKKTAQKKPLKVALRKGKSVSGEGTENEREKNAAYGEAKVH